MKRCTQLPHTSSLTPLSAPSTLIPPNTTSLSSVSRHSEKHFFLPFIPSLICPSHSGIHTGAIDLERAVVGDSCKGVR